MTRITLATKPNKRSSSSSLPFSAAAVASAGEWRLSLLLLLVVEGVVDGVDASHPRCLMVPDESEASFGRQSAALPAPESLRFPLSEHPSPSQLQLLFPIERARKFNEVQWAGLKSKVFNCKCF